MIYLHKYIYTIIHIINSMTHKETAIQSLESIAHWMRISSFDYEIQDLDKVLDEVKQDYKKYLDDKSI